MQALPDEDMHHEFNHENEEDEEQPEFEEDYYSNFARRVYDLAKVENWSAAKTRKYFNDREAFEKVFRAVSVNSRISDMLIEFFYAI